MEAQHMTQKSFSDFTGIAQATISGIFKERTKPTLSTVEAIKDKFPNINIDWLMFGKGPMFLDGNPEEPSSSSTPQVGGEQTLNFGDEGAGVAMTHDALYGGAPTKINQNTVQGVNRAPVRTDIVYKEKEVRRITEIRVFYDDQTWESFVPKK